MEKVKVLFPYVEAGLGHIMPMKAVEEIFRKKYGDKVEIVSTKFFTETKNDRLLGYHDFLVSEVKKYNSDRHVGYWATKNCEFWGTRVSMWCTMTLMIPGAKRQGIKLMEEISPDVVFSTHWATNYYAEHLKKHPVTISYCPDAIMNALFEYRADLTLISMPKGYNQAFLDKPTQYNDDNLKLVPFLIRNQAFEIDNSDKAKLRRELGLPEDKFTIVLAEGGYGLGRMKEICELIVKTHLPVTVIPICGKNEELANYLRSLEVNPEVTFLPHGFTEKILQYEAASDLFLGKSGNIIAEPTFFGVPSIITNFSTMIEENIGDHYINVVGSAMKEFDSHKIIEMIESFINNPELLEPYKKAAQRYHSYYGAEKTADLMWEKICETYPDRV